MKKKLFKIGIALFFLGATIEINAQYDTKVGINTETPSATLNVRSVTGQNTTSTKNLELHNGDSKELVTVLDNGYVGINTKQPTSSLEVSALGNTYEDNIVKINMSRDGSNAGSGLVMRKSGGLVLNPTEPKVGDLLGGMDWEVYTGADVSKNQGYEPTKTSISAVYTGNKEAALLLRGNFKKSVISGIAIDSKGNVGIGIKTSPYNYAPFPIKEMLDVEGAIKVGRASYTSASSTPNGGAGTFIYDNTNNHFYGYVGGRSNKWIQLDNEESLSEVKVPTNQSVQCNAANAGLINFGNVTTQGKTLQAFGFCMKDASDKYRWFYIYGASNVTSGAEGAFGAGL